MNSRKDIQILALFVTFLLLAGCFFVLAPSTVRAAAPDAPTGLKVAFGDGKVTLNWVAPSNDGGKDITNYNINRGETAGSETLLTTVGNVTTYTDSPVDNGKTYYYTVSAVNGDGEGPQSTEVVAKPVTVPDAPTGLTATPGDGEVALTWTAPANTGGALITYYMVYVDGKVPAGEVNPTGTSYTVTGLTNGKEYTFAVSASNSAGEGAKSTEVKATPDASATGLTAPTNLQATSGNGRVTLTWTAPSTDGGNPVSGYKVYRGTTTGSVTLLATVGNVTTYTDSSVSNGQTYYYTVSAVNSNGEGPQSDEDSATPVAVSTVPSAPLALASTAGNGQVTLTWTAPASDGGSSIDYYIVYRDGVDVGHGAGTSMTVTGLTNGQQYSFTVAAHNSIGTGPQSAAVTATAGTDVTVPGAPTGLTVSAGDGQVTLSWTAPADNGGEDIDYYIVYQNGVDVAHPTSTSAVITGLTNGQSYRFMVAAHNGAGTSPMTTSKVATPKAVDSSQWLLIGALAVIAAAGIVVVFMMWRKRATPEDDELPSELSPRFPPYVPPQSFDERPAVTNAPEVPRPQMPPAPPRVTAPVGRPPEVNAPPRPPAPSAQTATAQTRITKPMIDQLTGYPVPTEQKRPVKKNVEEAIICPRCGRPNSGRSKCAYCGKKLK